MMRRAESPDNYDAYNESMAKSLEDKLWFINALHDDSVRVYADFGCADGAMLKGIAENAWPLPVLVGMDNDPIMVERSGRRWRGLLSDNRLGFRDDLAIARKCGGKSILILSSVVHEVISQGETFENFWEYVRSLDCDYIAIRDMAPRADAEHTPVSHETVATLKANKKLAYTVVYGPSVPGFIRNRSELLQCLLKYRYTTNLFKECRENYFPMSAEAWLNRTTIGSGYKLRHFEHYALPYNVRTWADELGLTIKDPTHIKILLERR